MKPSEKHVISKNPVVKIEDFGVEIDAKTKKSVLGRFGVSVRNFFDGGKPALVVPQLELLPNTITAIIGPSGAGKSVFNSLLMEYPAFRNEISPSLKRRLREVSRLYLPQIPPDGRGYAMPAREYLKETLYALLDLCGVPVLSEVDYLKPLCDGAKLAAEFDELLLKPLSKLSGGERHRVEFCARMLAVFWVGVLQDGTDGDGRLIRNGVDLTVQRDLLQRKVSKWQERRRESLLLILDEPTTGFDYTSERDFLKMVGEWGHVKNLAVVVTTHALGCLDLKYDEEHDVFDQVVCVVKPKVNEGRFVKCCVTSNVKRSIVEENIRQNLVVDKDENPWQRLMNDLNSGNIDFDELRQSYFVIRKKMTDLCDRDGGRK